MDNGGPPRYGACDVRKARKRIGYIHWKRLLPDGQIRMLFKKYPRFTTRKKLARIMRLFTNFNDLRIQDFRELAENNSEQAAVLTSIRTKQLQIAALKSEVASLKRDRNLLAVVEADVQDRLRGYDALLERHGAQPRWQY